MGNITKYILKSINYLIITIVIIFAMLMVGVKIFGIQIYTVLSGSMEPTYKVGSLIYVTKVDSEQLKVGDVITFKVTENVTATHRIIDITKDENNNNLYTTKGDVNETIDEIPVKEKNIIGKPIFTIPYLGYISTLMNTNQGKVITTIIGILLLITITIIDSITDNKIMKKRDKI